MSRKNLVLLITAFLLLVTVSLTLSKYASIGNTNRGTAQGANFVLKTSFKENEKSDPYYVYDDEINFDIMNFDGVNQSNANMEISYIVNVYPEATITDSGSNVLASGGNSTNHISISDLTEGAYKVVIKSTAPYSKTITLYFYAEMNSTSYYTVTEHDYWTQVDLYVGSSTENISVTYTGAPDNSIDFMSTWSSDATSTLSSPQPFTHYKMIFFSLESISMTQGGSTLPVK